ncbi:Golgin subfamily A member 7B [Acipenser ruthenus]|uniref:Golgin subfamily A member 7B n=1 Tax=Acipenser ruthenus TaxID=7906 RepID=A0A444UP18_ACIRT|nr:Golgin subfamily A member 7B [Acipenser ruthenus]
MPKSPLDPQYKCDATFQWDHAAKNNKQLYVFQGVIVKEYIYSVGGSTQREIFICHFSPQFHNLQELRRSASLATKVFIQRDYTEGTTCQFQTKFPAELDSRIERQLFEDTVKTLNNYYAEAEKIGGQSYLEGCLACATAYIIFMCMETRYEKLRDIQTHPINPFCSLFGTVTSQYLFSSRSVCPVQVPSVSNLSPAPHDSCS